MNSRLHWSNSKVCNKCGGTPVLLQDLVEMTVRRMDKDRDGKVSFTDYKQTVRTQLTPYTWKFRHLTADS